LASITLPSRTRQHYFGRFAPYLSGPDVYLQLQQHRACRGRCDTWHQAHPLCGRPW